MLDEYNYRFIGNNEIIQLTPTETMILSILIKNKGKVVSFNEMIEKLYGNYGCSLGNIRLHMKHLRDKLKYEFDIKTIRNVGYIIV